MCTCASCIPTDKLEKAGFAEWPRGNPAGRKSAAEYSAHVKHGQQWGKGRVPEIPPSLLVISADPDYGAQGTRRADPGAHRSYPKHADTRKGWTTAAYVEAFIEANGYVTPAKVKDRQDYRLMVKREERAAKRHPANRAVPRLVRLARDLRKAA